MPGGEVCSPELQGEPISTPTHGTSRVGFGLYNIWKPAGVTSRHVVDEVGKALGMSRVGHAGTLDPLATGVLVLCAGQASRLVPFIQQQSKEYVAVFRLGCTSDTDDVTGSIEENHSAVAPTRDQILKLLPEFTGRIEQVPPDYSAVRVRGRRAHHLARRGRNLKIPPRVVEVYRLELLAYEYPRLELLVKCGSGTYVRSIGRDLGERLGCGGVLSELVRTRVGTFSKENAIPLENLSPESLARQTLPTRLATAELTQHRCTPHEMCELVQGRRFPWQPAHAALPDRSQIALLDPNGELAAVSEIRYETGWIHPFLVFPDREEILRKYGQPQKNPECEALASTSAL